jgi:hypothetical protein
MKPAVIAVLLTLVMCGCATPYNKKWNEVYVTQDKSVVSACKYIDVFHSWPPYVLPNDDIKNLTRRAAEVGADTVLVTGARLVSTEGQAYRCH